MSYLKALGVLRVLSEQSDTPVSCAWRGNVFQLRGVLNEEAILEFFLEKYRPTPIVVPWSGNDFFAVPTFKKEQTFKKTPTGSAILAAFLLTTSQRLQAYREAISVCLTALKDAKVKSKDDMKKAVKSRYLALLRSRLEGAATDWLDAAAVILTEQPKFSVMLGSGGGSDGNTHFSDNFMQNIWEMLPDFDEQRGPGKAGKPATHDVSRSLLNNALFARPSGSLVVGRTSSLFDSGAVGGPNAGQGFERDALANPWNFILALEGVICFAGAATRRFDAGDNQQASFPFQVVASPTGTDSLAQKEEAGREVWLPEWKDFTSYREIRALLAEGRLSNQRRSARTGMDAARAAASLGMDRGIIGFYRYAIVKGRVGGENYNTAAFLGAFPVRLRRRVDLLNEATVERWLTSFRKCCLEKESEEDRNKGNARFTRMLRGIDRAVFNFCRYGDEDGDAGDPYFQEILVALGRAQRAVAAGESFRTDRQTGLVKVRPLGRLSAGWLTAAADSSPEFALALSLSGIYDANKKPEQSIGPVRVNLEPVVPGKGRGGYFDWADRSGAVVWTGADLAADLLAVLLRRQTDATRTGGEFSPFAFQRAAPLSAVARFLAGETEDVRIDALLAGLVLLAPGPLPVGLPTVTGTDDAPPLPRAYALLKLLFLVVPKRVSLPPALVGRMETVGFEPRFLFENLRAIKSEPSIPALLRAGRVPEACRLAMRRLRAEGLNPFPHRSSGVPNRDEAWNDAPTTALDGRRLAASLLFPISEASICRLCMDILRPPKQSQSFTTTTHQSALTTATL